MNLRAREFRDDMMDSILDVLPEDCIAVILSRTSPVDVCRFSLLSSTFRSAADSDLVWEKFLPPDYHDILSRAAAAPYTQPKEMKFCSKKQLFLCLCSSLLMDGANKSFKLDKFTAKKSYMLSARELRITWGDNPMYWSWRRTPDSRFREVAELRTTCWLEIEGRINTQVLTPNTTYGAYLVINISDRAYGLDSVASEVSVILGNHQERGAACLCNGKNNRHDEQQPDDMAESVLTSDGGGLRPRCTSGREDGWREIELGRFKVDEETKEEVNMSLKEIKGHHLKGGLIIEGLQVRPLINCG